MGYSEVYCSICGVSFNIARIRHKDEPEEAGWGNFGRWDCSFVGNHSYEMDECYKDGGCSVLKAQLGEWGWRVKSRYRTARRSDRPRSFDHLFPEDPGEDDGDGTYEDGGDESDDDEPYEYESPPQSEAEVNTDEDDDETSMDDDSAEEAGSPASSADADGPYRQFIRSIQATQEPDPEFVSPRITEASDLRPISVIPRYPRNREDPEKLEDHEHIAGPGCGHKGGYSGHRITVEEMLGCTTSQCLVYKPDWWRPEDDDEDFEREGRYFLSGIRYNITPHSSYLLTSGPHENSNRTSIITATKCQAEIWTTLEYSQPGISATSPPPTLPSGTRSAPMTQPCPSTLPASRSSGARH
jgi:hypothetical protein